MMRSWSDGVLSRVSTAATAAAVRPVQKRVLHHHQRRRGRAGGFVVVAVEIEWGRDRCCLELRHRCCSYCLVRFATFSFAECFFFFFFMVQRIRSRHRFVMMMCPIGFRRRL